LKLHFDLQQEDEEVLRNEIAEAKMDFKLGIMDPSRAAALMEKQYTVKKIVGKKKKEIDRKKRASEAGIIA